MPKFVIERTLPGAGALTTEALQAIAQTSNETLEALAGTVMRVRALIDPTTAEDRK